MVGRQLGAGQAAYAVQWLAWEGGQGIARGGEEEKGKEKQAEEIYGVRGKEIKFLSFFHTYQRDLRNSKRSIKRIIGRTYICIA